MAVDLVSTVGAATANSYGTVAEADAYFATRVGADAWTAMDDDGKAIALITATRRLDAEEFVGSRRQPTIQSLKWPRTGVINFLNDEWVGDNIIPRQLKEAQFELALYLVTNPASMAPDANQQFSALRLPGGLHMEFNPARNQGGELPPSVIRAMRGFVTSTSSVLLRS